MVSYVKQVNKQFKQRIVLILDQLIMEDKRRKKECQT